MILSWAFTRRVTRSVYCLSMLTWWSAPSWLVDVFQGCYEKVEEWLDDNKHLLGTIAMCVLVIQVSVSSRGARPEGLLQHKFISTSCVCVCVSSAPRDGLLHDSLPADPQVRKEVRSLRTKAATLLIRGTWYITVSPVRTAYSVTFSLFFIIVKPNQLLFWNYNLFIPHLSKQLVVIR